MAFYSKQLHIKLSMTFCAVNIYDVFKGRSNWLLIIKSCIRTLSSPPVSNSTILCCIFSESFVTALLLAGHHPGHINVVVCKELHPFLNSGVWQGSHSAQDPGKINVEESQDIRAGIHQGIVHIVSGQNPVRGVGQDCCKHTQHSSEPQNQNCSLLNVKKLYSCSP